MTLRSEMLQAKVNCCQIRSDCKFIAKANIIIFANHFARLTKMMIIEHFSMSKYKKKLNLIIVKKRVRLPWIGQMKRSAREIDLKLNILIYVVF